MSACSEEATEYHEQTCTVNDYQSDGEMEEEAPMEGAEDDWWADEDGAGAGVRVPPRFLWAELVGGFANVGGEHRARRAETTASELR
jgi:hypothetical protein